MKYGIVKKLCGTSPFIEINPEKYKIVKHAQNAMLEVFHIEEKLHLIVENYREYEQELLNSITLHMLFSTVDWPTEMEEIRKLIVDETEGQTLTGRPRICDTDA